MQIANFHYIVVRLERSLFGLQSVGQINELLMITAKG